MLYTYLLVKVPANVNKLLQEYCDVFYSHSPGCLHVTTPTCSNSWQATFLTGIITVCIFSESVTNTPNLISCPSVLNCHLIICPLQIHNFIRSYHGLLEVVVRGSYIRYTNIFLY